MKSFVDSIPKNAVQVRAAILVVLAVALVIPQLAWAGHTSDRSPSSFSGDDDYDPAAGTIPDLSRASSSFSGDDDYDPAAGAILESAGAAQRTDAAFLAANPEIVASSAGWVALGEYYTTTGRTFLATNPEIAAYQRHAAQQGSCEPGLQC